MLEAFEQLATPNRTGGFAHSHVVCLMDWAIEGRSYVDDAVELNRA
jgi:hypothetical protein